MGYLPDKPHRATLMALQQTGNLFPERLPRTALSRADQPPYAQADDDRAVVWSKPEDITINPRNPAHGLLGHYGDGFQAALAAGSVTFVKKGKDPAMLWALFTRAGGEVVDFK